MGSAPPPPPHVPCIWHVFDPAWLHSIDITFAANLEDYKPQLTQDLLLCYFDSGIMCTVASLSQLQW